MESGIRTLGYVIKGRMAWPLADPHTRRVCVFPLSPEVIPHTDFCPRLARTLHLLLCTFEKPVSSAL